jgi:CPA1 family monovalent cation:H+ antiporter
MEGNSVHAVELVFLLLLLFVVVFATLAQKIQLPYPIVLVIAGLVLSFIPGTPKVTMSPDIIFLAVLPPLLYAGAWFTSWRDFSYNIVTILFLAFGLVGFTALGVAEAAHYSFAHFDLRLGFVLGAVVATTDTIAATSIARRVGLPSRIVDVLEGESLVNDATGLLALEFGIAMVVQGHTPTMGEGFLRLTYLIAVGIAIGLVVAFIVQHVERYLDDGPIEIVLSVMIPYVAYLAAQKVGASAVLSVVTCGLYLGRRESQLFSPSVRLQAFGFWSALTFAMNGLVFVLIGLQLPFVLAGIHEYPMHTLVLYGAAFSALVIVLRLAWVYPGAYAGYWIRRHIFRQSSQYPSARAIFVVGWAGMRGVIALAAALALPEVLADGSPFPQRNLLIFLTFCVILVTLVFQGLTLPPLIRGLGLANVAGIGLEEKEARRAMVVAALEHIKSRRADADTHHAAVAYQDAVTRYKRRLAAITGEAYADHGIDAEDYARIVALSRELLHIERDTAVRLRNEGRINDAVLRQLEREIDLSETRLDSAGRS